MPLRNSMFGVFKLVYINQATPPAAPVWQPYLVSQANTNTTMQAQAQSYVQGTAETRILDISTLNQEISLETPILVGPAYALDGRSLLGDRITTAADKSSTLLPILESATVNISSDSGATVSMKLRSDGSSGINSVFKIEDPSSVPPQLNPLVAGPSRTARNYDFIAQFGPYKAFVREASIEVAVELEQTQFLIPYTSDYAISDPLMGTQYPYLGVAGIKITGTGSAAAEILSSHDGANDPQNSDLTKSASVTIQTVPDLCRSAEQDIILNIGPIVSPEHSLLPGVDISKTVINSTNFKVTNKLITVDFGFTSWVKIGA